MMSSSDATGAATTDPAPQEQVATVGSDETPHAIRGGAAETSNEESMDRDQNKSTAEAVTASTPSVGGATPAELNKSDINTTKPEDFEGEVATTSELPSTETIRKIENYLVLDRDGKSRKFKSLYNGRNVARRVLVIFVRHFFCGNCQEYIRTLCESITPDALLQLPVSTFIVIVGCGEPALIDMYVEATKCPFPIYTDPTRSLFDELGMAKTLALGSKPAYMKKSMWKSTLDSIAQGLRALPQGNSLKSGDKRQVGGEFLFEPLDIVTPIVTPQDEQPPAGGPLYDSGSGSGGRDEDEDEYLEVKHVSWAHRMKTTRDHAEIPELMEVLGLDGHGMPIKNQKRWSKALESRKGEGLSMAGEMGKLSELNQREEP